MKVETVITAKALRTSLKESLSFRLFSGIRSGQIAKFLNLLVLALVIGLGFAVFAKHTDQSLSTPDNVERRLGLPVLASVMYKK